MSTSWMATGLSGLQVLMANCCRGTTLILATIMSRFWNEVKAIDRPAVLDGEIVVEDEKGNSRFQDLQNFQSSGKKGILRYYVFDLLMLDGHDTRRLELYKRKELLKRCYLATPSLKALFIMVI